MPPVAGAAVKDRAARLRAAGEAALTRHLSRQDGRRLMGLVERDGVARAEDFTEIAFAGAAAVGEIAALMVTGHDGKRVIAKLAAAERPQRGAVRAIA
jgi:threonylcarbamoyladenosine tRNA methylthiotransferase MtaB